MVDTIDWSKIIFFLLLKEEFAYFFPFKRINESFNVAFL